MKINKYLIFIGLACVLMLIFWRLDDNNQPDTVKLSDGVLNNKENVDYQDEEQKNNVREESKEYRETFRDPFFISKKIDSSSQDNDHRSTENDKTQVNSFKIKLPFLLIGIIGNSNNKLAILKIREKIEIVEKNFQYQNIKILDILSERLIIKYKKIELMVKPGSDIGVS